MNHIPMSVDPLPIQTENPSFLYRRFSQAGPPSLRVFGAGEYRVISVPGHYSVSYFLEGPIQLALVDVGSVCDLPRLEQIAQWLGKPVRMLLPTHLHCDHIMGLEGAARLFRTAISLGRVAREHVEAARPLGGFHPQLLPHFLKLWITQGAPLFRPADLPRGLRFGFPWSRNQFSASLGPVLPHGQDLPGFPGWSLLETPGHSHDSICLFHPESGSLIAGDTLLNYQGGEWNRLVADPRAYQQTRSRLCALPIRVVFPGHGPPIAGESTFDRLRAIEGKSKRWLTPPLDGRRSADQRV